MLEGRSLALRLARKNIPVELLTDAALLAMIPAADLILIGCDAILADGFVNKVGTQALLCLARGAGIPCYVAADTFKFLPPKASARFQIRQEHTAEVWRVARRNLRINNFYFEKAPFQGCAGVVSEQGVWPPEKVRRALRQLDVSPALE